MLTIFAFYFGLNMFFIPIKLASSIFGPCKKKNLILIQTFLKVLILVLTISLCSLTNDLDDREPRHYFHVNPRPQTSLQPSVIPPILPRLQCTTMTPNPGLYGSPTCFLEHPILR